MKVRGTNTHVNPVYWAHLRRWPYNVAVEYEVSEKEYAEICADDRISVDAAAAPSPLAVDDTPVARSRKGK